MNIVSTLYPVPSIIAGIEYTAGNIRLITDTWRMFAITWYQHKDKDRLVKIMADQIEQHQSKEDEIVNIYINFVHLSDVDYPRFSTEFWENHNNLTIMQKNWRKP